MADLEVRITGLPVASALADTDSVVVDRASGTGRATIAEVAAVIAPLTGGASPLKASVRVVASYENPAGLTAGATVNGVELVAGDRVLIAVVEVGADAGIYEVQTSGDAVRASDMDSDADIEHGALVWAREGAVYADSLWALTTDAPIVLGTTAISFARIDLTQLERAKLAGIEDGADVTDTAAVDAAGAVMDGDFAGTDAGTLTRTGVGTYAVRKDNLAAGGVPTTGDDAADGYSVGSLWVTGSAIYMCRDATTGFAEWVRVRALSTATPEPIGAAGSAGASADVSPANHVHAHGAQTDPTMHAEATTSAAGFMSAIDKDHVLDRLRRILLWQDEFVLGLTNRWGLDTTGAGAAVSNASAGAAYPGGKANLSTGSTATGVAGLRAPTNIFYAAGVDSFRQVAIVGIGTPLPDGTDNFVARVLGLYLTPSLTAGFSLLYDHTVSANWRLVRYAGGVVAASADTGIAAATGTAPVYSEIRWEIVYTPASGGTVTAFADGVQVAQLTGSFTGVSAVYPYVARIEKTLGTNARNLVVDYSYADCVPAAGHRK